MPWLDKLDRKFGRFAVPQVTLAVIGMQVMVFCATLARGGVAETLSLIPRQVENGETWRLITFLFLPPTGHPIFAFLFWYMFWLMGGALEANWGALRYNVYLLIAYLATVAVAFLTPDQAPSNAFLFGSVFLAFAFLFPDFVIYLFLLIPVKIKWLALIAWVGYGLVALFGSWDGRLQVLAAVCNFLLFFWRDILAKLRGGRRHMANQASRITAKEPAYFHRCTVCGVTDRSNPGAEFRYCSKCAGNRAYCLAHLRDHEHVAS
jgi:hypothetical protein